MTNDHVVFGWLDVCLRVSDVPRSLAFYERLGFKKVEGELEDGWVVVSRDGARIGLFAFQWMEHDVVSLNFRGGDGKAVLEWLVANGIEPDEVRELSTGASIYLRDPDGHLIFIDGNPRESMPI